MSQEHLDQFNGQASVLVPQDTYEKWMRGKEQIGYGSTNNDPHGSMYVSKSEDIDRALKESGGDISKVEASLGLPEGHFGDGPLVRVDINNPEDHGLRMANGKEAGANPYFNTPVDENGKLPDIKYTDDSKRIVDTDKTDPKELAKLNGQYTDQNGVYHEPNTEGYKGKTSGGLDEAVINQVPNTPENVSYTKIDGFKRDESSDLKTSKLEDGYSSNSKKEGINSSTIAGTNGGGARAPNEENGIKNVKSEKISDSDNKSANTVESKSTDSQKNIDNSNAQDFKETSHINKSNDVSENKDVGSVKTDSSAQKETSNSDKPKDSSEDKHSIPDENKNSSANELSSSNSQSKIQDASKSGSTNQNDGFSADSIIPKNNSNEDINSSPDKTPKVNDKGAFDGSHLNNYSGMGY